MAHRIYQVFLTYLNYTLCKKLPQAQLSKTIKDVLNPTETHTHKIHNLHTLLRRFLFSSSFPTKK